MRHLLLASLLGASILSNPSRADDWPQWLGPQRDSVYQEQGVVDRIPKQGLKVKWRTPIALGYSGPAVAQGRVYVMDGMIYGCDINSGALMGVRLTDGQRLWQTTAPTLGKAPRGRYGTAFLVKHRDRFFLFSETGDLILAKLSPQGYEELGRFHVLEPTSTAFGRPVVWSHPAFAEHCCFARNDKEIVCVSLALSEEAR